MKTRRTEWQRICACFATVALTSCHGGNFYTARKHRTDSESPGTLSGDDLFHVAMVHADRGDWLRAEQYLSVARAEGYDETSAVFWLVRVCVAAGRYQSALTHLDPYLRLHPADAGLRVIMASLLEALGDRERARRELERTLQFAPTNSLAHYRLALLYLDLSADRNDVTEHLEAYLALDPLGAHAAEARAMLDEESER